MHIENLDAEAKNANCIGIISDRIGIISDSPTFSIISPNFYNSRNYFLN